MPVILAKAISELSDNVVLYYQTKEVDLESDTIVKACSNPANYFIKFSKASKDQTDYLKKMLVLFNVPPADNFRKDTSNLSSAIKKVFIGMPQIVRLCNSKNNYLKFDDSFLVLKSEFLTFNVNAYESVFEMPKKAFKTEKYANIYKGFEQIVNNKDHLLSSFKQEIIATIKELFSFPSDSSLKSSLTTFLAVNIKIGQEPILEATDKALYTTIRFGLDYDDETCLDLIAKVITNQAIEDWDSNKEKQLLEGLSTFKTNIENSYQSSVKTNVFDSFNTDTESLSSMGKLLKNNVESAIDEFSGSVSSSEKITILAALLKDLL